MYKTEEPLESPLRFPVRRTAQGANSQASACAVLAATAPSLGAAEMRPVVPIRRADFFSSALDFCFQSSISGSVSLEKV